MPSQKLVRCSIRHSLGRGSGSPRYVPLEIYGLWEHLMTSKHGFEVLDARASLWIDIEDAPETAYGQRSYERVTEVTAFVFSDRDDMFTRARRYFPSDQAERLKQIFLSHYEGGGSRVQNQVHEREGVWLHRALAESKAD